MIDGSDEGGIVDERSAEAEVREPTAADWLLPFVGMVAAITGFMAERTWLVLVGVAVFALGSILAAWSMWRRVEARRQAERVAG